MIYIREKPAKKLSGLTNLFLTFDYNLKTLEVIRNLPSRFFHKETKEWEIPLSKLPFLINNIEDQFNIIELKEESKKYNHIPKDYIFKTTPYSHQLEGIEYGLNDNNWILGDDQGLGKTKQIIDLACILKKERGIKHCLIVCGVNNLKYNWEDEIKIHSNERSFILGTRILTNGKRKIGSILDRIEDLKNLPDDLLFIITNVETLRDNDFIEVLKKTNIDMMVIDEVHRVKNPTSEQGKNILKTINIPYKVALSGTMIMNSPLDAYTPLKWLGVEKSNFSTFKNYYCVYGGFGNHQVLSYKNLNVLRDMISQHMLRRLKSDVLDLPPKIHQIEYVEMKSGQKRLYKEIQNGLLSNLTLISQSLNPLEELLRLRQVTDYTGIISSTIKESAKFDRLEEIVEDLVSEDKKCIIFTNWEQVAIPCRELLKKYNPAYVAGDIKDIEEEKRKFQNDPNCKIIIGTTSKLGTGHTLTAASTVIFLDSPWNKANKEQAEDRAYRIGTKGTVNVITLVCKDTIDEKIEQLIDKKGAMADLLIDGKMTKQNYQELLKFLLED